MSFNKLHTELQQHLQQQLQLCACRLELYDFIYHQFCATRRACWAAPPAAEPSLAPSPFPLLLLLLLGAITCWALRRRAAFSSGCPCRAPLLVYFLITFYCPLYKLLAFAVEGRPQQKVSFYVLRFTFCFCFLYFFFCFFFFGMQRVSKFVQSK